MYVLVYICEILVRCLWDLNRYFKTGQSVLNYKMLCDHLPEVKVPVKGEVVCVMAYSCSSRESC